VRLNRENSFLFLFIKKVCERGAVKFKKILVKYFDDVVKYIQGKHFTQCKAYVHEIQVHDNGYVRHSRSGHFFLLTSDNVKIESVKKQGTKEWRRDVLLWAGYIFFTFYFMKIY
jgi:hypothetical protein